MVTSLPKGISLEADTPSARILVVDDDPDVAKTIENSLRKQYKVFVVYSGIEAIKESRRHPPDLIVLDVRMPDMDGLETCQQLRRDPALADIPILFLTALGRPEDRVAGLKAGGDDYLTKPFNLEELQLRIKAILRRVKISAPPPSPTLEVRGLKLDRNTYQVMTPAKQSKLTPIEFDLLYHLMMYPHEVFSSDRLLQEVWDYPSESGSPDLVRMHIKNLRDKIETDPRHPEYIITIPRRGYTISSEK